jgi:hypothetical protein
MENNIDNKILKAKQILERLERQKQDLENKRIVVVGFKKI